MLIRVVRWATFSVILLIQAGAVLEAEWLTGAAGALTCLFLTVPQEKAKKFFRLPYKYLYLLALSGFLIASYIDMKYIA